MSTAYYTKFRLGILFPGILLCVFHYVIFPIPEKLQWAIFLIAVILVGIPHGAIDHLVEEKSTITRRRKFCLGSFLARYIFLLLLFGLLWQIPLPSFILFIFLSAYHFGETDLFDVHYPFNLRHILYLSYGLFLISFLLLSHFNEVIPLLKGMGLHSLEYDGIMAYFYRNANPIRFTTGLIFASLAGIGFIKSGIGSFSAMRVFEILLNIALVTFLPLFLAFAYYFGFWHSLLSIRNIYSHLQTGITGKNNVLRQTVLLSMAAFALIAVVGLFYRQMNSPEGLAGTIFIGLAILTLPHMQVMHGMYLQLRKKFPGA